MKKKTLWVVLGVALFISMLCFAIYCVGEKKEKVYNDEEILAILTQKSGIDFSDATVQQTEYIHVSAGDSGICVVLLMDKEKKKQLEETIKQMRYEQQKVEDDFFPKNWKEHVKNTEDYVYYDVYNGARKKAKCLNQTSCLFVLNENEEIYTVYVSYAGD